MTKDRFGEDIEVNSKSGYSQDEDLITYEIRGDGHAKGEIVTVRCCLCRKPLKRSGNGWCYNCQTYPINITPLRFCDRAHRVNPDGFCVECDAFKRTALEPINAQWIDSGIVPKRLEREQIKSLVAEIVSKLSGPGWPDKQVPLREDYIPRAWKRGRLRKVGETPLGYRTVLPADAPEPATEAEVPF